MNNPTLLTMAWMAFRHARDVERSETEQFRQYHYETGCDWARLLRFAQDRNAGRELTPATGAINEFALKWFWQAAYDLNRSRMYAATPKARCLPDDVEWYARAACNCVKSALAWKGMSAEQLDRMRTYFAEGVSA